MPISESILNVSIKLVFSVLMDLLSTFLNLYTQLDLGVVNLFHLNPFI